MSNVSEHELLSAYVDGELTAAEQARIERLLTADAAARQLVEELRALGSAIKSLPREKLGDDLGPVVLRAAERRMLARDEQRPALKGTVPFSSDEDRDSPRDENRCSPQSVWRELSWRGLLSRRALFWSGAAVVIALLLTWNENRQARPPERQVALAQKEEQVAAAPKADNGRLAAVPTAEPSTMQARGWNEELARHDVKPGVKLESSAPRPAESVATAPIAGEKVGRELDEVEARRDGNGVLRSPNEGFFFAADRKATGTPQPGKAGLPAAPPAVATNRTPAQPPAPAAGGNPSPPGTLRVPLPQGEREGAQERFAFDNSVQHKLGTDYAAGGEMKQSQAKPKTSFGGAGGLALYADPARAKAKARSSATSGRTELVKPLVVVQCNVTAEALSRHLFDDLLGSSGLVTGKAGGQGRGAGELGEKDQQSAREAPAQQAGGQRADADSKRQRALVENDKESRALRRSGDRGLVVYELSATPAQVSKLVQRLTQRPEAFADVSVSGAASAERLGGGTLMVEQQVQNMPYTGVQAQVPATPPPRGAAGPSRAPKEMDSDQPARPQNGGTLSLDIVNGPNDQPAGHRKADDRTTPLADSGGKRQQDLYGLGTTHGGNALKVAEKAKTKGAVKADKPGEAAVYRVLVMLRVVDRLPIDVQARTKAEAAKRAEQIPAASAAPAAAPRPAKSAPVEGK
jgi:hypothetical protein